LIVFKQDFAYANRNIDNNIKDILDAIFAYVNKNVANNVVDKDIKDICKITFNNKERFIKDNSIQIITNKIEDNFVNNIVCFVKIVSIHTIANTNNLVIDNFANNVENILMLIIVIKKHVKVI